MAQTLLQKSGYMVSRVVLPINYLPASLFMMNLKFLNTYAGLNVRSTLFEKLDNVSRSYVQYIFAADPRNRPSARGLFKASFEQLNASRSTIDRVGTPTKNLSRQHT